MISQAKALALKLHGEQRYGNKPYVAHLEAVVGVLVNFGFTSEEWLSAAYLHDVIEDCAKEITDKYMLREEIRNEFGSTVSNLVWAVTGVGHNRKTHNADITEKIATYPDAAILKLADRVANVEAGDEAYHAMYLKELATFEQTIRSHVPAEMWDRLLRAFQV